MSLDCEKPQQRCLIPTISYLGKDAVVCSSIEERPTDNEALAIYDLVVKMRHFDERMINLQRQGLISFAMSALGEEVCIIASAAALEKQDWIYPQYREQAALFWRGYGVKDYLHHMFCNKKDIIKGRQMPNHFGSKELNVVTVSSPVGTQIVHAAGCGYAMKLENKNEVAFCYFGEGTASEGDFHVGLNFAAVKKTPTIFFCRNNHFAISTRTESQFASFGIAERGIGYNIETMRVDGNDAFAVYSCVKKARKLCLEGRGPVLIEAMTYRLGPHSTSDDPTAYRKPEESACWSHEKCGKRRLRLYLESKKLWNEEKEMASIEAIKKEIDEAIEEAKKELPPEDKTVIEDVYFEVPSSLKRQFEEVMKAKSMTNNGGTHA